VGIIDDWDIVLKANVEALGVLAHEHQIDIFVPSSRNQSPSRPDVCVQIERSRNLTLEDR
jgi:hypothetical protein